MACGVESLLCGGAGLYRELQSSMVSCLVCLSCLSAYLSVCLSVCLSVGRSVCLSVCLSVCPSVCPPFCLSPGVFCVCVYLACVLCIRVYGCAHVSVPIVCRNKGMHAFVCMCVGACVWAVYHSLWCCCCCCCY